EGASPRHRSQVDPPTVEPLLDSLEARPRGAIHELRRAHEGHQGRVEYVGHEQPIFHRGCWGAAQKERTEQANEDPERPGKRSHHLTAQTEALPYVHRQQPPKPMKRFPGPSGPHRGYRELKYAAS